MVGKRSINLKFTNNILNNKKSGFTLAEVLITLSVIGVVAVVTMPAMYGDIQSKRFTTKLISTVSEIETAFTNSIIQEGADNLSETKMFKNKSTPKVFANELGKYIAIADASDTKNPVKDFYSNVKTPCLMNQNGKRSNYSDEQIKSSNVSIVLEKNAYLFIQFFNEGNVTQADRKSWINKETLLNKGQGVAVIDVNGKKEPNTVGRDIFGFVIGQNGILYPYGGRDVNIRYDYPLSAGYCNENNIKNSWTCTAKVLQDGNKIKY